MDEAIEELKEYKWPGNLRQLFLYIENTYFDCLYAKQSKITRDVISQSPPRDGSYGRNDLEVFEKFIHRFIDSWTPDKGRLLQDVIEPIIAKCYLEKKRNVTDSSSIVGIDGSAGKNSTLQKRFMEYEAAKQNLST
jgi:DNA-binding NtrC family response regulator